ncbi:MAG: glycosyltransferase family 2 protein [Candidatus Margulisiibacteriota bacterium]
MDRSKIKKIVTFVIPVRDEESAIVPLYEGIKSSMQNLAKDYDYEVLFVDDGSKDGSWQKMTDLGRQQPDQVKAIRLSHGFGKSVALSSAFLRARGDIVITMDGDLQDDPVEIPNFLAKIEDGFDLVSGWKQKRNDPLSKTMPSKIFNFVTALVSGIKLHDFNCGYKAYRRAVIQSIHVYGELHRYIPVLAYHQGFNVGELAVHHNPRKQGRSKYGLERYLRGFLDLLTVMATTRYLQKPGHLFGGTGILFGLIGFFALAYLTALKLMGQLIGDRPLLIFGVMMIIMGVQFISLGLIAELIISNRQQQFSNTKISETVNLNPIKQNY